MKKNVLLFISVFLFFACSKSDHIPQGGQSQLTPPNSPVGTENSNGSGNIGFAEDDMGDITSGFKSLMSAYDIHGAQVAIVRNEKLVYLQSMGKADVDKGINVTNSSLFRIGGISKPITLMAISKLVSENILNLDDFVFGSNGLLGNQYGSQPYDPMEKSITVSHLLEHKGGFTDEPFDIMFDNVSFNHSDLIGKVLDERSLTYEPGTKYVYSNFGYCLLGRIIEKVTGKTYEEYVSEHILGAMNKADMKIGGNTRGDALPGEVTYYSHWLSPYSINVTRMDAHGGWVASAKSLAFLAVQSDANGSVPDLFPSGEGLDYLKNRQWNHNGALPGTTAVLQVGYPISYVVLTNTGEADFHEMIQIIRNFMNDKISEREKWPRADLFNYQ